MLFVMGPFDTFFFQLENMLKLAYKGATLRTKLRGGKKIFGDPPNDFFVRLAPRAPPR